MHADCCYNGLLVAHGSVRHHELAGKAARQRPGIVPVEGQVRAGHPGRAGVSGTGGGLD